MFCTGCGNTLGEGDRFCGQCGKANAPGPGEAPRGAWRYKQPLRRDLNNKKIAGVCAGLAKHLEWDVTLVRVLFLVGIVLHGAGLIAYAIGWIAMPPDDAAETVRV